MQTIRITNSFGESIAYHIGCLAGVDTREPYWWLSDDKRAFLRESGAI